MLKRFSFFILILAGITQAMSQAPAFPTAEGFGKWATGGRGGRVVEVTTLSDDADNPVTGSLRWALKQYSSEPITVVFRVSGIIDLAADIRCNRTAGTTIAGQTAPGDGICIRGGKCNFGGCQNLVIRHVRFRIGLDSDDNFLPGGSIGIENASNWIIDHCTFGWSGEENMTIYDNTLTTVQWCIIHEGLYDAGHGKGVRSYGSQWGGQSATYHHNLLAHNKSRSPRFNGARSNDANVLIDYVNNVNYNWGGSGACYGADWDAAGKTQRINFVGNYYKPGPAYPGTKSSKFCNNTSGENPYKLCTQWYMNGNYIEGSANTALNSDNYKGLDYSDYTALGYKKSDICMSQPFTVTDPVTTETAANAYKSVLEKAGAFPRDAVDLRIIGEVKTGTAKYKGSQSSSQQGIIDRPSDVGGYPVYNTYNQITDADHDGMEDSWELSHGLDPTNPNDGRTIMKNGYSVLEVYLDSLCGETIEMEEDKTFDAVVASDNTGDYTSLQTAIDNLPSDGIRHLIFVKNGTYNESVSIDSNAPAVSIIGESLSGVTIASAAAPTLKVCSEDFYMENVTLSSDSAFAAFQADGDRCTLKNCNLKGNRNILSTTAGLRSFYYKCTIEGQGDLIQGNGCTYLYKCTLKNIAAGCVTATGDAQYSSSLPKGNKLYYNAFLQNCTLTASTGVTGCCLGRVGSAKSGSIFLDSRIGNHITAEGWFQPSDGSDDPECSFGEYNSLNAAGTASADVSKRASFSFQVSASDRYKFMTAEKVFAATGSTTFDPVPSLVPVKPALTLSKTVRVIQAAGGFVRWTASENAVGYVLYANKKLVGFSSSNCWVNPSGGTDYYTVYAVSPNGAISDASTYKSKYDPEALKAELYTALNPENPNPDPEPLLGDVNGDGYINTGDLVGMVNLILDIPTEGLNRDVADVNQDNQINVGDCVALTNYILYGSF